MAITTTITSVQAPFSQVSPIQCTITFSENVTGFTIAGVTVTGGSITKFEGVDAVYTVFVSPTNQGSSISVSVGAGVATNGVDNNLASNVLTSSYSTIKPRATIAYGGSPITALKRINATVTFDKSVTGFSTAGFELVNAAVLSCTGTGTTYQIVITPTQTGQVEFYTKAGAATDSYGNTSAASNSILIIYEADEFEEKSKALAGDGKNDAPFGAGATPELLGGFSLPEIKAVSQIQSLADCAKNIPQRLLQLATTKAFEILNKNPDIKKLTGSIEAIQQKIETVKGLVDKVQALVEHPETLLQNVLATKGLTGEALQSKMTEIKSKFSSVPDLDKVMASIDSLGICNAPNFGTGGQPIQNPATTPTDVMPPPVDGVPAGVATNTYDTVPKDKYDDFSFQLKEQLEASSKEDQSPDRSSMITLLSTLAMGYHDETSKTTDASKDADLLAKYKANVESEKGKNGAWEQTVKDTFALKAETAGSVINRNADVIRAFYMRNAPISGKPVSVGITTYGGPATDFTTYLDIKPSERPPELTAKYQAQGRRIPSGNSYTNSAGKTFKTGTLSYADAFNGAYGKIVVNQTCASTRFPGGSIIALRNPDGTVYDPTGKNPAGQYKVTDTGNSELTYAKPDIFTDTPELYKNMGSVQVYLVSQGSQRGAKYLAMQKKKGGGATA